MAHKTKNEMIVVWIIAFITYLAFGYALLVSESEGWITSWMIFLGYSLWMISIGLTLYGLKLKKQEEGK